MGDVGSTLSQQSTDAIANHLAGEGYGGGMVQSAGPVEQAGEEGQAVWATKVGVLAFGAERGDYELIEAEPGKELVYQVELSLTSAADGRVMPLPFAVIFLWLPMCTAAVPL
jgi:hypothetical protein